MDKDSEYDWQGAAEIFQQITCNDAWHSNSQSSDCPDCGMERPVAQPPAEALGADEVARQIVKHISDAALELAFIRHDLTSDEFDAEDYPDVKTAVQAKEAWWEEIKTDALACLTGDETGCNEPEDMDATNCELIWLTERLTSIIHAAEQRGRDARVDLSPARPEPWDAVRDLLSLMQQDSHGMWAFNSLSRDASMFQAIIERLHAATPASHVDEERIAEIRTRRAKERSVVKRARETCPNAECPCKTLSTEDDIDYLLTAYDELRAQRDRLIHTLETRAQRETEMLEEVAACARLAKEPAPADRVEGEQESEIYQRMGICGKRCGNCEPRCVCYRKASHTQPCDFLCTRERDPMALEEEYVAVEQPVSQEQRETKPGS